MGSARDCAGRRVARPGRGGDVAGWFAGLVAAIALLAAGACSSTVDSLGYNGPGGITLHKLVGPSSYPNSFHDLGKSDADITAKINGAFNQLFHGDPSTQAIYFPVDTNQAQIQDILHGDIRTEGMGYGMIIAVELNKQDEFNRLWRFAKASLEFQSGASRGYFRSSCDTETGAAPCTDPFGMEQFVTALLLAWDHWTPPSDIDYGADAVALLDVMRHIEDRNGGVVDNVINVFDPPSALVVNVPDATAAGQGRPSIEMPGYYELWAQATGDPFWTRAAASARAYWKRTTDPTTGLTPVRATFDGVPVAGFDTFQPESYRAQIQVVIDQIWFGRDPWEVSEANTLLGFFSGQGIDSYGTSFTLDGSVLNPARDPSLVAVNGLTAAITTNTDRLTYVDHVWNLPTPVGVPRYYSGILDLLALLVLSGQFRVL
jgi:oligosaccharide reducing-end xylanase